MDRLGTKQGWALPSASLRVGLRAYGLSRPTSFRVFAEPHP
jgi:hypothetical protein